MLIICKLNFLQNDLTMKEFNFTPNCTFIGVWNLPVFNCLIDYLTVPLSYTEKKKLDYIISKNFRFLFSKKKYDR